MSESRVLIVDDSAVFRRLLQEVLSQSSGIEVVGTANNGKRALEEIERLKPDLVTLDVEMPVMDGIAALREISAKFPKTDAIMFSSYTTKAATKTIEALTLGAKGFVAKPRGGTPNENVAVIESELVPLIHNLKGHELDKRLNTTSSGIVQEAHTSTQQLKLTRRHVVAIGVSTGGPNALQEVLPNLPANLGVPVLIVQHMPPVFTKQLADRLNNYAKLTIVEAEEGMQVEANKVYIAPGDYHMEVTGRSSLEAVIKLHQGPRENQCRPAVDPLFRSVAKMWGKNALGVILTGMGSDGMLGSQAMRAEGAAILAQDVETSVVWGMPGAVASRGLADQVLPIKKVAPTISELVLR